MYIYIYIFVCLSAYAILKFKMFRALRTYHHQRKCTHVYKPYCLHTDRGRKRRATPHQVIIQFWLPEGCCGPRYDMGSRVQAPVMANPNAAVNYVQTYFTACRDKCNILYSMI